MNILLVTNEFPPDMATGGIGSYMSHLAHLLHHYGHQVFVISETTNSEFEIVDRGFCTNYLIPQTDAEGFRKKASEVFEVYLLKSGIDVMESPEVQACALEIKNKYPHIPLVVKLHTPGVLISKVYQTYQPFFTKIRFVAGSLKRGKPDAGYWRSRDNKKSGNPEYKICCIADQLLSPSLALKQWISRYWNLPGSKIKVIPNPFLLEETVWKFPIQRSSHKICFIGKLSVLKGMIVLTEAMKIILNNNKEYKFILCGNDEPLSEEHPSMKEYMKEQLGHLSGQVCFLGRQKEEDVYQLLGESEISVVPSLWENFPAVVAESMAAGAAVVASDAGGIPEIIIDGKTGLLFPPKNSRKMAACIQKLINDPALRQNLASEARKAVEERNSRAESERIIGVYSEIVSGHSGFIVKN